MEDTSGHFNVAPSERVGGRVDVPGDKSISHRAVMLAAIAEGTTRVGGFLRGEDCLATLAAFEALGVPIRWRPDGALEIRGVGLRGLSAPRGPLDFGNSGTAMRLMAGLLAGQPFDSVLTGDASLRARPMERVAEPLRAMGARIQTRNGGAPVRVSGGAALRGIDYALPVASAQIKSALLLAALYAQGRTSVRSPGPSRDHTERMLAAMGVTLGEDTAAHAVWLEGPQTLRAVDVDVPGDFSSAAFFIVAGCLGATDGLVIENVGMNPSRTGLLTILESMGAHIERRNPRLVGTEPVADLYMEYRQLEGVNVPAELVPLAIDEFPILFVAAAGARGRTVVAGAEELRHKESDRIAVMAGALTRLGCSVRETPDGIVIEGGKTAGGRLRGGRLDSGGDHRVAMAFAVAALISDGPIRIGDTAPVATSFPGFADTARRVGLAIETGEG